MQPSSSKVIGLSMAILVGAVLLTSCDKDDEPVKDIVYGQYVPMGNGQARSFIRLDQSGKPASVGFTFNRDALNGLPHNDHTSFVMDLPAEKAATPYNHISVDWAPHGHEPEGVYNKPHFDMHFYMISKAAQMAIQPGDAMQKVPAPEFIPKNYIHQPGEGISKMGKHWGDITSPEFQGKPFTTTFIYGSFDGKVTFHEPMVSHDFLLTKPDTTMAIGQPTAFERTGLRYPANYSIRFDKATNVYTVSLDGLTVRQN